MPSYLFTVSFGQQDLEDIAAHGGTPRQQAVDHAFSARGGRLLAFFFTLGAADAIAFGELPDDRAAASVAISASRHSGTKAETIILLTAQDIDEAAKGISDV